MLILISLKKSKKQLNFGFSGLNPHQVVSGGCCNKGHLAKGQSIAKMSPDVPKKATQLI